MTSALVPEPSGVSERSGRQTRLLSEFSIARLFFLSSFSFLFPFLSSFVLGPRALCFPLLAKGDCQRIFHPDKSHNAIYRAAFGDESFLEVETIKRGSNVAPRIDRTEWSRIQNRRSDKVLARFVPNQRFSRRSKVEVINRALGRTSSDY